ncbi:MAG: hypothetical protein IIT48_09750 [Lachnospiraceae bacterium]|nr:hypothetical protein [Lachnospiraceae bacterium]
MAYGMFVGIQTGVLGEEFPLTELQKSAELSLLRILQGYERGVGAGEKNIIVYIYLKFHIKYLILIN